jgi:hypothetical protein
MKRVLLALWVMATLVWLGTVWRWGVAHWPMLSMDLPPNDPQVRAALDHAVLKHEALLAAAGLLPPLLVLWLGRVMAR